MLGKMLAVTVTGLLIVGFEWPKIMWLLPLPVLTLAAQIGIYRAAVP